MKILAMNLSKGQKKGMQIQYKFIDVQKETETVYKLKKPHLLTNNRTQIKKDEIDKILYNEVVERRDCKECDFSYVHLSVCVLIEDDAHRYDLLRFWRTQIKNKAMEELKERNKHLKSMYAEITKL